MVKKSVAHGKSSKAELLNLAERLKEAKTELKSLRKEKEALNIELVRSQTYAAATGGPTSPRPMSPRGHAPIAQHYGVEEKYGYYDQQHAPMRVSQLGGSTQDHAGRSEQRVRSLQKMTLKLQKKLEKQKRGVFFCVHFFFFFFTDVCFEFWLTLALLTIH